MHAKVHEPRGDHFYDGDLVFGVRIDEAVFH